MCVIAIFSGNLPAQVPEKYSIAVGKVSDEDTLILVNLPGVDIIDNMSPLAAYSIKEYLKLRYNVLKVYPYAKKAAIVLEEIETETESLKKKRKKRKYVRSREDVLREQFEEDLKKLTITQGKILMKLIDRETGHSSYDLLKDMRGGFRTFLWQGAARLYGTDLKNRYDPEGEDLVIERIVQGIESGELTMQTLYVIKKSEINTLQTKPSKQ